MKILRWVAVAATALMSLMNLPFAFEPDLSISRPLAWAISVLGVVGLVAATGLAVKARWGRPAVIVVGLINLVAAVIALANHIEGAPIGLVVSAVGLLSGLLAAGVRTASPVPTA